MANLGPIGSGQPPAILLASWDPLAPPPVPITLHVLDGKARLVLGLLLLLLEHHGDVISSRRPWARVRRQFRPRACGVVSHFLFWEKFENSLEIRHPQDQLESERMTQNSVLGENLEGLHREQDCQRSARQTQLENDDLLHQTLLHSVLGENLEDAVHHCVELEWQQSCSQSASTNYVQGESLEDLRKLHDHHAELECQLSASESTGSSALPPAVPPAAAHDISVARACSRG